MKPILFKIGEIAFPSYTFLIMFGILMGVFLGIRITKSKGLPVIYFIDLAILGIMAGFLGARIGHVFVEAPQYYLEAPLRFFYFWQGGFTSWGAHIGMISSWYFYLKWRGQPVWAYFDVVAQVMFVAIFFGRAGCLLTGCCFGNPTDFFLSLTFSDPTSTAYHFYPNIPLHATQIYLMLNVLIAQIIIWVVAMRSWKFQGQLFALGLILYPIGRALVEFFRGDVDRGVYLSGWVSAGQIAMIFYVAIGLWLYGYLKRKDYQVLGHH